MKFSFVPSRTFRRALQFFTITAILLTFSYVGHAQISISGGIVVQNYVPPPWAPPYDNVSSTRYYYFPDYGFYYDVWEGLYWYLEPGGQWISSPDLPPGYGSVDMSSAFIVLIDRNVAEPWRNYTYYYHNYPAHGYQNYKDIVVRNRIVTNIAPNHELVPRAFNENTNRVTFMQRQVRNGGQDRNGQDRNGQDRNAPEQRGPAMQNRQPQDQGNYHRMVHEVPVKSIAPSMPAETRNTNFARGYTKQAGSPGQRGPAQRGPAQRGPAPGGAARGQTPQGGQPGGAPNNGQRNGRGK